MTLATALASASFGVLAQADSAGPAPHGFIYSVAKPGVTDGQPLMLYGTLHVGRSGGSNLDGYTKHLISVSQHVVIELDPRDQVGIARAMQAWGKYPDGDHLAMHVDAELDAHAQKVAAQLSLPAERAEQLRPLMLSNVLSVLSLTRAGLDPRRGSEALLVAEAAQDHKDVIELEGADAQLKLLGQAPSEVQADALRRTLQQIDSGRIADEAKELLAAWEKSDTAAMDRVLENLSVEDGLYPKFMAEVLLKARDVSMADAVEKQMARPGSTLFAVGALHLFGPDGLIATLRQRGYTVTPLTQ